MINPLEKYSQYWNQGRMNFYFGGSIDDCEYKAGTWQQLDWVGGYEEAKQALEESAA